MICTVELNHHAFKKKSWIRPNSKVSLRKDASGLLVLLIENIDFEMAISLDQKIRLLKGKVGFSLRSFHAECLLKFTPENESLSNLYKSLQGPSNDYMLYTGHILRKESIKCNEPINIITTKPKTEQTERVVDLKENIPLKKAKQEIFQIKRVEENNMYRTSKQMNDTQRAILASIHSVPNNTILQVHESPEGFRNMGQTCYISCVFQLIIHSNLRDPILKYRNVIKGYLGLDTIYEAVCDIIQRKIDGESVDISRIKYYLENITKRFLGNNQEDAHELLLTIMDQLSFETILNCNQFEFLKQSNPLNSIEFTILQVLKCEECGNESRKIALNRDFCLDLPKVKSAKAISLSELVKEYFREEVVDYLCPCGGKTATLLQCFQSLPPIFILHIKRFGPVDGAKCRDKVQLPKEYQFSCTTEKCVNYTLNGIISHLGESIHNGHYIYDLLRNDRWDRYDDSFVTKDMEKAPETIRNSYIIVYQKNQ